jgi:rod shape-determining protein MreD
MRVIVYFLLGLCFILLQASLFPRILPGHFRPDLLLIMIVLLGLNEDFLRGGTVSYLLGYCQDVFAGVYPGLYGFTMLLIFMLVRGTAGRMNAENFALFLSLVFLGTLLEGGVILFSLGFFADVAPSWSAIPGRLLPQLLLNLLAALLVLKVFSWLHRRLAPPRSRARGRAGLSRHES